MALGAVRATLAADYLQLVDPDRVSNPHGWASRQAACKPPLRQQFKGSAAPPVCKGRRWLVAVGPGARPPGACMCCFQPLASACSSPCREHALEAYRLLDPAAAAVVVAAAAAGLTTGRGGQAGGKQQAE